MERALVLSGGGARGAFHVGVVRYLEEIGWKPNLICGTSIGAIVASALASGLKANDLIDMWKSFGHSEIYNLSVPKFIRALLSRKRFHPLMDTTPLKETMKQYVDFEAIQRNPMRIIITAANMKTSQIEYFESESITIDHLIATSAMPMLFPWQVIGNKPYWDAGLMVNTPILPALKSGARSIVVVFLSPAGVFDLDPPETHKQVAEMIIEHSLIGSYMATPTELFEQSKTIKVVAPKKMLGLGSILNFSHKFMNSLIKEGYECAKNQLRNLND